MATLTPLQVKEINAIIEKIEAAVKPKHEIGAQSKTVLTGLLAANKIEHSPIYFKCRREYSDQIISYFVNEKKLKKNRFHRGLQEYIYLIK